MLVKSDCAICGGNLPGFGSRKIVTHAILTVFTGRDVSISIHWKSLYGFLLTH